MHRLGKGSEMSTETADPMTPNTLTWLPPQYVSPAGEYSTTDDGALARAQRFQEIYTQYLPIILKTARAFTHSKEDREDLSQEILIALWKALEKFEARSKLSTYVYRIAYRRALNWKRGQRRYDNKLFLFEREQPSVADHGNSVLEAKIERIYRALGNLKPIDRTICLLILDGLHYSDIAEILGVTETIVGVRVHRCKQHLVALLEKNEEGL